jgi:hypothetical protein
MMVICSKGGLLMEKRIVKRLCPGCISSKVGGSCIIIVDSTTFINTWQRCRRVIVVAGLNIWLLSLLAWVWHPVSLHSKCVDANLFPPVAILVASIFFWLNLISILLKFNLMNCEQRTTQITNNSVLGGIFANFVIRVKNRYTVDVLFVVFSYRECFASYLTGVDFRKYFFYVQIPGQVICYMTLKCWGILLQWRMHKFNMFFFNCKAFCFIWIEITFN